MWQAITRMPLVAGKPALMFGMPSLLLLAWTVRDLLVERRFFPLSLAGDCSSWPPFLHAS